jgi:hypothetical protein
MCWEGRYEIEIAVTRMFVRRMTAGAAGYPTAILDCSLGMRSIAGNSKAERRRELFVCTA